MTGGRICPVCGAPNGACGTQRLDRPPVIFAGAPSQRRRSRPPDVTGRGAIRATVTVAEPSTESPAAMTVEDPPEVTS